ncbi:MAG: hypothetical protein GY928_02130 [Colwellia sp.]|nr:hypothetical protein [Colwellia sp.]
MSQIDSNLISIEANTRNANQVKDHILKRLEIDGLITEDQAVFYADNWQMIIVKSNWFDRWRNRFGIKKDVYKFKYVKFED